jgi:PAS domain S-box-containing protein
MRWSLKTPAEAFHRLFGDDSERAGTIRARQIGMLAKATPPMALGLAVNSALTGFMFWRVFEPPVVLGWVMLNWAAASLWLAQWFFRRKKTAPQTASRRAAVRATYQAAIAGGLWGGGAVAGLAFGTNVHYVFLAFVLGGQAAAVATWLSALPTVHLAYVLLSTVPLIAALVALGGALSLAMAVMLALFTAVLLQFARNAHQAFLAGIAGESEKEALIAQLRGARDEMERKVAERTAELSGSNERLAAEVADRKQAEVELRASRRLLETILDTLPTPILAKDQEGRFTLANKAFAELHGAPVESLLGRTTSDVATIAEEEGEAFLAQDSRVLSTGEAVYIPEQVVTDAEGGKHVLTIRKVPLRDDENRIIGLVGSSADITEQIRAEEELRASRDQLRLITDNLPAVITYMDAKQTFKFVNKATEVWFGLPAEKILGRTVKELFAPQVLNKLRPHVRSVLGGETVNFEETVEYPDGNTRIVDITYVPDVAEDGTLYGYFGLAVDITDRVRAEEAQRKSEQRTRAVIDHFPATIFFKDLEGRYQLVNKVFEDWFCVRGEEIRGEILSQFFSAEHAKVYTEQDQAVLQERRIITEEQQVPFPDGRTRSTLTIKFPVYDEDGELIGVGGVGLDNSERRRVEEELRASRDQLRLVTDNLPVVIAYMDREHRFRFVNRTAEHWYARPAVQILGQGFEGVFGREQYEEVRPTMDASLAGEVSHFEQTISYPDGNKRTVEVTYVPDFSRGGAARGFFALGVDVSERIRSEEELRSGRRLLRAVFDSISQWVFVKDRESRYIMVNQPFAEAYNLHPRDFKDRHTRDVPTGTEAELERFVEADRQVLDTGKATDIAEYPAHLPDGRVRVSHMHKSPLRDEEGKVVGLVGVAEDVTEQRQAEVALRHSEEQLRLITDNLPVLIAQFDAEERYEFVNATCAAWYGLAAEEFIGKTIKEIRGDDYGLIAGQVKQVLAGEAVTFEIESVFPDGQTRTVLVRYIPRFAGSGRVVGFYALAEDSTQQKQTEEQLRQAQKMEAVGQLAGGVAHDFNNMLQIIHGYTDLVLSGAGTAEQIPSYLQRVLKAAEAASRLTRQLLAFSRKQLLQPSIVEVNGLLTNLMKMLGRLIGEDIELRVTLEESLAPVHADPGMLEQVIVNLCVNARDAMPEGGQLEIRARNFHADATFCAAHEWETPGDYVQISVADTGIGMAPEVRERLFEPFFTTKEIGKGTGLGLSMVYGIIAQHGGSIDVNSEPGVGTTVNLFLPVSMESAEQGSAPW